MIDLSNSSEILDIEMGNRLTMAFSDDNEYLAVGNILGQISIFSLNSKNEVMKFTVSGRVRALAFSRNGTYLVSIGRAQLQVFNLKELKIVSRMQVADPFDKIDIHSNAENEA